MPIDIKNKYPPDWLTVRVPRILERAGNACEVPGCGKKSGELFYRWKIRGKVHWFKTKEEIMTKLKITDFPEDYQPTRTQIQVAHLDHDEWNHDVHDDRLQAMCQLHHLQYDAQEKADRKKRRAAGKDTADHTSDNGRADEEEPEIDAEDIFGEDPEKFSFKVEDDDARLTQDPIAFLDLAVKKKVLEISDALNGTPINLRASDKSFERVMKILETSSTIRKTIVDALAIPVNKDVVVPEQMSPVERRAREKQNAI